MESNLYVEVLILQSDFHILLEVVDDVVALVCLSLSFFIACL